MFVFQTENVEEDGLEDGEEERKNFFAKDGATQTVENNLEGKSNKKGNKRRPRCHSQECHS